MTVKLTTRLRRCFDSGQEVYCRSLIFLSLVVHILLGYRRLRDSRYYRDDPMVQRLLGLEQLPDVATVSRALAETSSKDVERLRRLCRNLVLQRLAAEDLTRLTLDFDGSVLITSRWAEGTAKGFKCRKRGQRSYYPLFCTLAQTGQVFDVLHRRGNVHDSNGAREFIVACIEQIRAVLPGIQLEARLDGAFFSDEIVGELDRLGVEFTVSVPFERFVELKSRIEHRRRWRRLNADVAFFQDRWQPDCWPRRYAQVFLRTVTTRRPKGPVQLDLFVYIPTRTLAGNQLYMLAAILAHNLNRELQMTVKHRQRSTTPSRAPLWRFSQLQTLRQTHIQRAGRLTRPQGALTLTISANPAVRNELLHSLDQLRAAA